MRSQTATIIIALLVGFLGGMSSRFWPAEPPQVAQVYTPPENPSPNPFRAQPEANDLESRFADMQRKISGLELQLNRVTEKQDTLLVQREDTATRSPDASMPALPIASAQDNLIAVGVDPDIAQDILRRISQQQYRRMELQNLMRRNKQSDNKSQNQQYQNELRELAGQSISMRSELGDDTYDQYLIASGANNRLKIASVMAGSPAESVGLQQDDVILYYGDNRIIDANDVRSAAWGGDPANSVNIEILRGGQPMSLTIPGGTMGVALQPIKLDTRQKR